MIKQLYGLPRKLKFEGKRWKLLYKFNKFIAVVFFPVIASVQREKGTDENGEIIVSLTSFPARIGKVWITISTLMNQSLKPKRIVLWLAEEQFPGKEKDLPGKLIRLKERGLEIKFSDDLKPHKKYYYTMKENPEDVVVTADDDMLYPENMLEQLWVAHKKYPDTVVCQFAHRITLNEQGNIKPYQEWESCYGESTKPDIRILPVGCGGVLYPPHCLDERVFNKEYIKELCPQMDDLWLKSMALLKGTKAAICNEGSQIYFDMTGTRRSGLQHENAGQNKNDKAMALILKMYPQVHEKLLESENDLTH